MRFWKFCTVALLAQIAVLNPQSLYVAPSFTTLPPAEPKFKKVGYLSRVKKYALFQLFGREIQPGSCQYYATSFRKKPLCFQSELCDSLNAYGLPELRSGNIVYLNDEAHAVVLC
jgi:hypothetical protein